MNHYKPVKIFKSFIESSETFASFTFCGMYDMDEDKFLRAFNHFVKTGENVLDEYSDILYIAWELKEWNGNNDFRYYPKSKRQKIESYLSNKNYWNALNVWGNDTIAEIKENCIKSENYDEYREKYTFKRRKASIYISNPKLREYIFSRDGRKCKKCGSIENLSLDHIVPVIEGGDNGDENLQVLCRPCNSSKGKTIQCG